MMPESLEFGADAPSEQPLHPSHPALPAPASLNSVHAAPAINTALRVALKSVHCCQETPLKELKSQQQGLLTTPWRIRAALPAPLKPGGVLALASLQESSSSISVVGNRACQEQRPAERSHWCHQIRHSSIITSVPIFFLFVPCFLEGRWGNSTSKNISHVG